MIACNISRKLFEDGYFHWRTPHPTSIGIAPHGPELTPSTQMWKTLVIYYICIHKEDVDGIMGSEPWGNQLIHGGARHFWTVHEGSAGIDGKFWFTMILHIVFLSIMMHHDPAWPFMMHYDASVSIMNGLTLQDRDGEKWLCWWLLVPEIVAKSPSVLKSVALCSYPYTDLICSGIYTLRGDTERERETETLHSA